MRDEVTRHVPAMDPNGSQHAKHRGRYVIIRRWPGQHDEATLANCLPDLHKVPGPLCPACFPEAYPIWAKHRSDRRDRPRGPQMFTMSRGGRMTLLP